MHARGYLKMLVSFCCRHQTVIDVDTVH